MNYSKSKFRIFIYLILLGFLIYYFIIGLSGTTNNDSIKFNENENPIAGMLIALSMLFLPIFAIFTYQMLPILFVLFVIISTFLLICYLFSRCRRNRKFKKLCKLIYEDIKKVLKNRIDNCMSESEIINYYSRKYGIDKNEFISKYIKQLIKICKNDNSVKFFTDSTNGKIFWELRN